MDNDSHLIFEAYKNNTLKDADGVEIVNPNVRKFDNDFYLDEYLQRILYNYRKYQNPDGSLNKQKFVQAIDSIWTGTHPRALQNLHQELSKARPDYKPETEFLPYLKNWLKKEALKKIWGRYMSIKKGSEDAEMPEKDFSKLKQHINKGPIKVKKPSKELPYTHNYIHHLAKQDPREDHKEENAEKYVYTDIEVAFNIGGNEYIAYGDVHFGEEGLHGKEEDTVENFAVIDAKTRQEVQDEGILKHGYNAVYNAGVNKSAEENQENDDEEGDLMTIMKQKGMIPQGAGTSTGKYGHHREEEEGICIEDLAKKFGVELSRMQDELEKGIKVEMEHTSDFAVATKIALDHLSEDPKYYIKLAKMENSENEERRLDSSCWKGYHKQGTKLKGGVRVNNCVKNS